MSGGAFAGFPNKPSRWRSSNKSVGKPSGAHSKNELKPWLKKQWCIPPKQNAAFVYHMEDVLEVYQRPYNPRRPQICLDEASKQLVADTREPLPMKKGEPERGDYEYERHGTCNLFIATEPLRGKRMVMDQLNTHTPASFYEAFPAEEARLLIEKLEIHDTPKHGSPAQHGGD